MWAGSDVRARGIGADFGSAVEPGGRFVGDGSADQHEQRVGRGWHGRGGADRDGRAVAVDNRRQSPVER